MARVGTSFQLRKRCDDRGLGLCCGSRRVISGQSGDQIRTVLGFG